MTIETAVESIVRQTIEEAAFAPPDGELLETVAGHLSRKLARR